ncbi:hypothetical protein B0H13DRAFT_2335956 [Mycena leptocephala]|nr:hypothetical protein B0H13DRAFT_2335956 [Mycena leptocephala]
MFRLELVKVGSDEQRLIDLTQLFVDRVDHFRLINGDKSAHEKAGFTFSLSGPKDRFGLSAQRDTRAACIDRTASDSNIDSAIGRLSAQSATKIGCRRLAADRVFINSGYDRLGLQAGAAVEGLQNSGKYHSAQYFIVPRGAPASERLTVLDCAILASVITDRARDYSSLSHMCCWYATMFFLCAHRICVDRKLRPVIQDNKLKQTGRWGKFRFIDYRTGRLVLHADEAFENVKKSMEQSMTRRQVSPEEMKTFLTLLAADRDRAMTDAGMTAPDPVSVIVELFKARRTQIIHQMNTDIKVAYERRTRGEREIQRVQQLLRVAEEDAKRAQDDAKQAQDDAKQAQDDAKQAQADAKQLQMLLLVAEQRAEVAEASLRVHQKRPSA